MPSQGDGLGHPPARQRHHGEVPAQWPVREGRISETLGPPEDDLWHAEEEGGGARLGTDMLDIIIIITVVIYNNGLVSYFLHSND